MIEFDATIRKVGDSLGMTIPKEVVKKNRLRENQKVKVRIPAPVDLTPVFGKFKCDVPTEDLIAKARTDRD